MRSNFEQLECRRLLSGGWHGRALGNDEVMAVVTQIVAQLRGDHDNSGDEVQNGIAADNLGDGATTTPETPQAPLTPVDTQPTVSEVDPGMVETPVIPDVVTTPATGEDASGQDAGGQDASGDATGIIDTSGGAGSDQGENNSGEDSVAGDSTAGDMTGGDLTGDTLTSTEGQSDPTVIDVVDTGLPTGDDVSGGVADSGGELADPIAGTTDNPDVLVDDATGTTDPSVFNDGDVVTRTDTPIDTGIVDQPIIATTSEPVAENTTTETPSAPITPVSQPDSWDREQTTTTAVTTTASNSASRPMMTQSETTQEQSNQQVIASASSRTETIPTITAVITLSSPPAVAPTAETTTATSATESKAVSHRTEAAPAAAKTASASASSSTSANPSVTGPVLPPAHSESAAAPAAPSAVPADVLDAQQGGQAVEAAAASGAPVGGWAWLLNNGLYGRIVGGSTANAEKPERTPRIVRKRIVVEGEAMGEQSQIDPAAAALAAQAQLAGDSLDTLADATDQLDEAGEVQRPVVAAGFVPAIESPTDTTTRNVLAAALAGTAVLVVQVHQWRKRKLVAAANKLAGLLQFDPLAVWLDDASERRE